MFAHLSHQAKPKCSTGSESHTWATWLQLQLWKKPKATSTEPMMRAELPQTVKPELGALNEAGTRLVYTASSKLLKRVARWHNRGRCLLVQKVHGWSHGQQICQHFWTGDRCMHLWNPQYCNHEWGKWVSRCGHTHSSSFCHCQRRKKGLNCPT